MVQKRHFGDHGGDGRYSKRKPLLRTVVEDLARGPSLNQALWEGFFRRLVREEAEKAVNRYFNASTCSHSDHQAGPSGGGSGLELRFINKIPSTIFTGSRIGPKDQSRMLQIVLFDPVSQTVVNTGPLSSVRVEIVALNGDFGVNDQEDWTEKQFNDSVLREREGRRPLVTGELTVTLSEGVGFLTNVVFTDNSSWVRSRKFRLGARIVQRAPGEVRVREARTEAFVVKDHRGELYQKHHPPHLKDEVWRLEKIAKDGAFHSRLAQSGIRTVEEFLQRCVRDPSALREILGTVSDKIWNAIVNHATNCVIDDNRLFAFQRHDLDVGVIFNAIHKVVGAFFNGQYLPLDALSPSQKILVENLKLQAYRNVNELVPVDGLAIAGPSRRLPEPSIDPTIDFQLDFQVAHHDQAPPDIHHQLVVQAPEPNNYPQLPVFPQTTRTGSFSLDDFPFANFNADQLAGWFAASSSQMPFSSSNNFSPENPLLFQGSSIPSTAWNEPGTSFIFAPNNNEAVEAGFFPEFARMSRDRNSKARWSKIRTAFKCLLSVKHAARKMPRAPFYLSY